MEYTPRPLMQDDCLKLLKIISHDIFQSKLAKIFLSILLLTQIVFQLITSHAVLYKLRMSEFVQYAPVFFSNFQGILALYMLIFKSYVMENFLKLTLWNLDSSGPEIHSRLIFEAKVTKMFTIFNVILTLIGISYFCVPLPYDSETFYMIYFIEKHFSDHGRLLKFVYRGTFFIVGYVMIVHAYQFLYATQHAEQEASEEVRDEDLYYNENYQKMIRQRLHFCIRRHQEFLAVRTAQINDLKSSFIMFSICGSMMGLSLVFYIFTDKFTVDYYPRVGFTSLAACLTFCAIMFSGQSVESESDETFKRINKVAWYNFNNKNKKTYVIMLLNMMQSWKIQVTQNHSVNLELGRTIVQAIYSVMSMVVNWV